MAKKKKWVRNVKTVSTYPPKDLFTKDAQTIARTMAKKSVSPKGIGSGIRMIQYFINRGGKGLSATRKRELEKAKAILQRKRTDAKKTAGRKTRRLSASRRKKYDNLITVDKIVVDQSHAPLWKALLYVTQGNRRIAIGYIAVHGRPVMGYECKSFAFMFFGHLVTQRAMPINLPVLFRSHG